MRPSGASRWVRCTASPRLEARYPDDRSSALEGNAAHWLAELLFPYDVAPKTYVGFQHDNGVFVADEMAESVALYLEVCRRHPGGRIEDTIDITRIAPQYKGTPDYWVYVPAEHTLYINDFKYGFGLHEPYENWQLISYAIGIIDKYFSSVERSITIVFTVVQPRPYHPQGPVRVWQLDGPALRGYANILFGKYREAQTDNAPATSGPQCRNCLALAQCHTAEQAANHAIDLTAQSAVNTKDTGALAVELTILHRASEILQWKLLAVEQQAVIMAKAGFRIPGYTLTSGKGSKVWDKPAEDIITLGKQAGLDLRKAGVMTPTKAKAKGFDTEGLTKRLQGRLALKPDGVKIKQLFARR